MATEVEKLLVRIAGDNSSFNKAVADSEKRVGKFSKTVKTALIGLASGLAVGKLVNTFKSVAEEMDRVAKVSSKLGIGTAQLIGLRHAANQTGVASNTLDMALQRMVRRVSEAAQGTGEAVKALEELGINAVELNRLSPEKQFQMIAKSMQSVNTQTDKVRLAFKLFDSEGVALVNTLNLGEQGLKGMESEARKLGITFSKDEAKKLEDFNDELDRFNKQLKGITQEIVLALAPSAIELLTRLRIIGSATSKASKSNTLSRYTTEPIGDLIGDFFTRERNSNLTQKSLAQLREEGKLDPVTRERIRGIKEAENTPDTEYIRRQALQRSLKPIRENEAATFRALKRNFITPSLKSLKNTVGSVDKAFKQSLPVVSRFQTTLKGANTAAAKEFFSKGVFEMLGFKTRKEGDGEELSLAEIASSEILAQRKSVAFGGAEDRERRAKFFSQMAAARKEEPVVKELKTTNQIVTDIFEEIKRKEAQDNLSFAGFQG